MNKPLKWFLIIAGGLCALIILTLIILPMFINVQKYKPLVEEKVSHATGRPFSIGDEIELRLFPIAVLTFNDLHLGNPPNFEEKDFVSIKAFDVRVNLWAFLLSRFKEIEVKRFVMVEPRIVLEKYKDGRASWQNIGKTGSDKSNPDEDKPAEGEEKSGKALPIQAFAVNEFAVTDGTLLYIDHEKDSRKQITKINLALDDLSVDQPIGIDFSALVEKYPIALEGSAGPLGIDIANIGKGTIHLDLTFTALKQLKMKLSGDVMDSVGDLRFDLAVDVPVFSPRQMMSSIEEPFPVKTSDPNALSKVGFSLRARGSRQAVHISDGTMQLDSSNLQFSAKTGDFDKPDVSFDMNLDGIDLDRYLPSKEKKQPAEKKEKEKKPAAKQKKQTDYTPLRKLVLDGKAKIGNLKIKNVKMQNITVKITGKNGVFNVNPASLAMYDGNMNTTAVVNFQQNQPKTNIQLKADAIQIEPLIQDVINKKYIKGSTHADVSLSMIGDDPDLIKKTLNGNGELLFTDGAIIGLDLVGMVTNIESAFNVSLEDEQQPKTEFTEFRAPFTITDGILATSNTVLKSPVLQAVTTGKASLPMETLDFRLEPRFVATRVKKKKTAEGEEEKKITEIEVPVLIKGTFSDPKFRPDLRKLLQKSVEKELFESKEFKKVFEKEELKPLEDTAKDIIRGILKDKK